MTDTLRVLCSFAYFDGDKLARFLDACDAALPGVQVRVFADSGAFTFASAGRTVSLDDYCAWLTRYRDVLDEYATFDVIGDHDATQRNTEAMEAAGFAPLPVFHIGTDFAHLEPMLDRYPRIALGGMVSKGSGAIARAGRDPYAEPFGFAVEAMRRARRTGTTFHGFGVTSRTMLFPLPWGSVDSSSWTAVSRFAQPRFAAWVKGRFRFHALSLGVGRASSVAGLMPFAPMWRRAGLTTPQVLGLRAPGSEMTPAMRDAFTAISVWSLRRVEAYLRTRHANPDFRLYLAVTPSAPLTAILHGVHLYHDGGE